MTENLSITGNGTIDFVGAGNLTFTGAFFGSQTVHNTGSGTLTIEPVYSVATASDLANAINAVNNNAIGQAGGVNSTINLTADLTGGLSRHQGSSPQATQATDGRSERPHPS